MDKEPNFSDSQAVVSIDNAGSVSARRATAYIAAIAALIALIAVCAITIWLFPREARPSKTVGSYHDLVDYHPGGTKCEPIALYRLASRKRELQIERCRSIKEKDRRETAALGFANDSAEAEAISAMATVQQARIADLALLLGGITMIAAIGAAYFAREAALHTARSNALALSENRPWIDLTGEIAEYRMFDASTMQVRLKVIAKNIGRSAARNASITIASISTPRFYQELEAQTATFRTKKPEQENAFTLIPGKDNQTIVNIDFFLNEHSAYGDQLKRIRPIVIAYCSYETESGSLHHSLTAWLISKLYVGPMLPPGVIAAPNPGLIVNEMASFTPESLRLKTVRTDAG